MYEEGFLMSRFNLTEKEKGLLKYAYIDNDRIDEGNLFDYQEAALHMIRKSSLYFYLYLKMSNEKWRRNI
jgi:hypothetical protein